MWFFSRGKGRIRPYRIRKSPGPGSTGSFPSPGRSGSAGTLPIFSGSVTRFSRRGIRLFGIVFEVQGWEYPAVMDAQGHILRLNKRAEEKEDHGWYGLREFSADTWPDAFPTGLRDYYPDGIRDEDGNPVTDLWEECCTRDREGRPIHAQWVEIQGHEETCCQMCRNNPVWREYLKKIMALQIDAGVPGIQLDECELPMTSISSGGCFCKSCMKQFREYLKERKGAGRLGPEWEGIDLETFHYGEYLKERNCGYPQGAPEILVPAGETPPACEVCRREGRTEVLLRNVGVYTVVAFGG